VIIKKKLFLKYKFSSNKTKEDYSLWLKLSKKKNIYGLNKELASWRKLDNSLSSNTLQKISDAFDIYYRQEKFNFILSITKVIILSFNFLRKSLSY
jgi:teichuronic acid biosynthesis glycosyltransferase TuaG